MARIINRERLLRRIAAIPDAIKANIRVAMEAGAEDIVGLMRSLVAVDSGDLKDSIGWTWGAAPRGSMRVASVRGAIGGMTITIYAGNDKAYYARWVEFGTPAHINGGKFRGTENPGVAAQPFFYVAFRAGRKKAKAGVRRAVTKAARQIAAGS